MSATTTHDDAINVDNFAHPYDRVRSTIAVLRALAEAKACSEDDDDGMWEGIADLTERALNDLRTMDTEYTRMGNALYGYEQRGAAPKASRAGLRPVGGKDGAA